jgi:transcriptional regulator with XRE-family HTH domain
MQYFYLWYRFSLPKGAGLQPLPMTGAAEITDALKRCLKARGMTYARLAAALDLSEASVKRLFSAGSFTLKRIEQICRVLEIDLFELARLARSEEAMATELTAAQEQALAADPQLLLVFHLVLGGWRLDEIVAQYNVSRAECLQVLLALDRLRLIDLQPNNEVRLRTVRHVNWRRGGPIRRAYQAMVLSEFFRDAFDRPGESLRFEAKELSAASREVIGRKLERLVREFNELAEVDAALAPTERDSVGLVIGLRPYVLSLFTRMKRARRRQVPGA